jgi:hypothetical protein
MTVSARALVLVLLLLVMLPAALAGQSTGEISGHVAATSMGALPGATITVTGPGGTRRSFGDGDGVFSLTDLVPGLYTVTIELSGFRTERRHLEVRAGETSVIDVDLRVGCLNETLAIVSHTPLVSPGLTARSDLVAYLRVDQRIEEDSPADPDCHVPYRVTLLHTAKRPSYPGAVTGSVDVWLTALAPIEPGKTYIIWLTWRSDKSALDSGYFLDGLVRPVVNGKVAIPSGPCVDVVNPLPDRCRDTYGVDELLEIFGAALLASR